MRSILLVLLLALAPAVPAQAAPKSDPAPQKVDDFTRDLTAVLDRWLAREIPPPPLAPFFTKRAREHGPDTLFSIASGAGGRQGIRTKSLENGERGALILTFPRDEIALLLVREKGRWLVDQLMPIEIAQVDSYLKAPAPAAAKPPARGPTRPAR